MQHESPRPSTVRLLPSGAGVRPLAMLLLTLALALGLSGCAALDERSGDTPDEAREWPSATPSMDRVTAARDPAADEPAAPRDREQADDEDLVQLFPGTGRFFDPDRAREPARVDPETGDLTLNFEQADLREVAHFILGEQLDENYVVDPAVSGRVTLQTSRPLSRDALLPMLENLLQMNGAALVEDDGLYRVVPREGALRNNLVPRTDSSRPGMNVRIVPLEYIAASEMVKILEPFMSSDAVVRADPVRNMLTIAGTRRQLNQWLETIEIFDVNWLEGMSVGLFTLGTANVGDIIGELEALVGPGSESPVAGLFRFIPIERLNAVLAITPQPEYLEEARVWVERLDRGRDMQRSRLHVYRLEHGKAEHVASLLSQVFGGEAPARSARQDSGPSLAPGMEPVELDSGNPGGEREGNPSRNAGAGDASAATVVGGNEDGNGSLEGEVRILADDANNALLVMASERDYSVIREALRELDIAPRQVLVDASIVEVTLTDELRYGLQWFFNNTMNSYEGRGIFGTSNSADLSRQFPGFNYSLVDSAGDVRAVLSALAEDSQVNVLSSPSIMVLDNHSASIRVGDQVPVRTSETTSAVTDNPVIVSNIQFRDTGVNLEVTPRVNSGGMVTMEVHQEVNDVSQTTSSGIDSPTIQQRMIQSSVAVHSGETIVLGGLIRESTDASELGVPGLRDIPLIGKLFGTTTRGTRRTELLVLITPRVANDAAEARAITEDFRRHMRGIEAQGTQLQRHAPLETECGKNVTGSCEKNNENP